jgi:TonB-linked SusC/RagA family outer membrane protein
MKKCRFHFTGTSIALTFLLLSFLFLKTTAYSQLANSTLVKGVVQNMKDEPLSDVSIVIKNLKTNFTAGTVSDNTGAFQFSGIPSGGPYTFTITAVGYEAQVMSGYNLKIESSLTLLVKLVPSVVSMESVVVVGYGSLKRKDLTGAVASLGSREFKDLGLTRIEQGLSGRVPGVQVKLSDGTPGAAPQIRIRGVGSISAGADPLFVVDGYPTDNIQTLNPNDIESLDVLKDASATAIYGSRGSNGVVIINTKRGVSGKPKISFDTYTGVQKVTKLPEFLTRDQQAQYHYDAIKNRNIDEGKSVAGDPATWGIRVPQTVLDVLSGKNTNNTNALDSILRPAWQRSYNLAVSGGSEGFKYLVSGEFFDQDGIIINSNFKRYSTRANFDVQLSKKANLKVSFNPSFTNNDNVVAAGGGAGPSTSIIGTATSAHTYYPLYNADRSYFVYQTVDASTDLFNPLALVLEKSDKFKRTRIQSNANLDYKFTPDLRLNLLFGATIDNTKGYSFAPQLPAFLNNPATGTDYASGGYNWIGEYTLNYNKKFGKHSLAALAGYTAQEDYLEANSLTSTNYPNNLIQTLSAVSGIISTGTSTISEWAIVSQLARVNYNYDGKYLLTASVRRDGSSRFGANNKYGVFPSAAAAWRVSDEKFMEKIRWIDQLKFRASYGLTGNNSIGNYASISTVNYLKFTTGGAAVGGFAPSIIPNPDLTWETQQQFNIGLDLSIKSRVNVTIDRFVSRNKDLLLNVNVPNASGFSTALKNIGVVKNTGWEFVLSTQNLVKKFSWSTDFNLSLYKNKVEKLGPSGDDIISGNNITRIGYPIGMFFSYVTDGVFLTADDLAKGPIWNAGLADRTRVGDIRFKDLNGDGKITSVDRAIMGSPYPDFYFGMTNKFSYGDLSLSINLAGSQGNMVYSNAMVIYRLIRSRSRTLSTEANYWKSEQDQGDGKTVRPNDNPTGGLRQPSSRYMDKGSFVRINNISLSYQVPDKLYKSLKLTSARIYFNATNPFIFTKSLLFNPDVSNSGNALTPGIDNNNYPLPKSFIVGFNLGF